MARVWRLQPGTRDFSGLSTRGSHGVCAAMLLICRGDLQPTQYAGVGLLLEDLAGSFLVFQMLDGGPAKGCGKFEVR